MVRFGVPKGTRNFFSVKYSHLFFTNLFGDSSWHLNTDVLLKLGYRKVSIQLIMIWKTSKCSPLPPELWHEELSSSYTSRRFKKIKSYPEFYLTYIFWWNFYYNIFQTIRAYLQERNQKNICHLPINYYLYFIIIY